MKAIFLDIDGVMNNSDSWSLPLSEQVLSDKVTLLKRIVDKTKAKIIISSSWRLGDRHMNIVKTFLDKQGLSVYSTTPILNGDNKRGDEIRRWLENNKGVTSFVILDDDYDMCEYTKTNLIRTDYNIGLTEKQVNIAIQMLNNN